MNQTIRRCLLLFDLIWISAAFFLAYLLRYKYLAFTSDSWTSFRAFVPALASVLGIWTVIYLSKNLDGFRGGWHLPTVISQVLVGVFYLMSFLLSIAFLQAHYYSRLLLLYLACLLPVGLIAIRCAVRWIIASGLSTGLFRRAVILGNGPLARELAYKIARHPEMLLDVIGTLNPAANGDYLSGAANSAQEPILLGSLNVSTFLQKKNIAELIVVMSQPLGAEAEKVISKCREAGMVIRLVPQWYELYVSETQMIDVDGVPLISLEERNISGLALSIKRIVDTLGSAFLLAIMSPVLFGSAVNLRRWKGRAFCQERRCGQMGSQFDMVRLNVDREDQFLRPFEKFLVNLSLTELPQLWNVLRGEMSLVGPRPEAPERVRHYSDWQRQRLSVKPGLTGLAQVHGLREQHSSEEKARFDLEYIYHWSPFLDFGLILQTAWTLAVRLMKQPSNAVGADAFDLVKTAIPEALHADRTQSSAD